MNCRSSRFCERTKKNKNKLLYVYNQDSQFRETFLEFFFSELQISSIFTDVAPKRWLKKLNLLIIYYGILKNRHCVKVLGKMIRKQDIKCDISQTLTPETASRPHFSSIDQSNELLKVQNFMSILLFRDISKYYLQVLFYSFAWVQFKQ